MKISVKFDNGGKGNARFSFKMWLQENIREIPIVYLLICNRENNVSLDRIDENYNKCLMEDDFAKTAGIEDVEELREYEKYMIGKIKKFEENKNLRKRCIFYPRTIDVEKIDRRNLPDIPQHIVRNNDILLKIKLHVGEDIEGIPQAEQKNCIIGCQFRIFLRNFLSNDTLKSWESSSESWSVNVDIHKERGFEDILDFFKNNLMYPKNLDLWINIPHNHLFIASSPIYENAIKLKTEDIQYKTYRKYEGERDFYKKFETKEGDYSVKINNNEGNPKEFSIICVSPFLPEEAPSKLREDMKEFRRKSREFVTWRGIIGPFALLIAAMSMVISATIAMIVGEDIKYNSEIISILAESFFYALFIWTLCEFINLGAIVLGKFDARLEKIALSDKKWLLVLILVILIFRIFL